MSPDVPAERGPAHRHLLLTGWRLLLVVVAWFALAVAFTDDFGTWLDLSEMRYFSQISATVVTLVATATLVAHLRGRDPDRPGFFRGAAATYATLTMVVFATLLGADYSTPSSALIHLILPILAIIDAVLVGTRRRPPRWWWPVVWLALPLAYLPVYVAASSVDGPLYDFLDPAAPDFLTWFVILLVGLLLIGIVLCVGMRIRTPNPRLRAGRSAASAADVPPAR